MATAATALIIRTATAVPTNAAASTYDTPAKVFLQNDALVGHDMHYYREPGS